MSISATIVLLLATSFGTLSDQEQSVAQGVEAQLAAVESRFQLGAEFFVNRTETQESIRQHFQVMKEHGLTRMALCPAVKKSKPRRGLKFGLIAEHCDATRNESA